MDDADDARRSSSSGDDLMHQYLIRARSTFPYPKSPYFTRIKGFEVKPTHDGQVALDAEPARRGVDAER